MQPKVSVIIPVYNVEKFLPECLDSVLNQTLTDIEIICVEDCSTDNSATILKEYSKMDSRINVVWHKVNAGCTKARKDGVLTAQGKYIMFLDSDDALFLHACETAYNAIEKYKTDVLEFGVKIVDTTGKEKIIEWLETEPMDSTEVENLLYLWLQGKLKNWMVWKKIYRSDICKQAYREMEDSHITIAEDVYLFCVLGYYTRSISMISEQLYLYRWGVGVSTILHTVQFISLEYYKKLLGEKDTLDAIARFVNNKPDKEEYKSLIQMLHDDWLHLAVSLWQDKLAEEDKIPGFVALAQKWGMEETAEGLLWLRHNGQEELKVVKNELAVAEQRACEAEVNVRAMQTGYSFRIGRILTYIPRKLLGRP